MKICLIDFDTGWLRLHEGDMVWVRDLGGTKRPEDDVIRFYYISTCVYTDCRFSPPLKCLTAE